MGRNHFLDRETPHMSSADKRTALQSRRRNIDFIRFQKETCFPLDFIEMAFEPSQNKRNTWRKRKRQESGVFKEGMKGYNKKITDAFSSIEKSLWTKFMSIKKNAHKKTLMDLLNDFHASIPGSGKTTEVVRYVAETFFAKPQRKKISECISDQKTARSLQDFAKIK